MGNFLNTINAQERTAPLPYRPTSPVNTSGFLQPLNLKVYRCPECITEFANSTERNLHLATSHVEKPYSCSACEKQFSNSLHLKRHLIAHTDVKAYPRCSSCRQQFSACSILEGHVLTPTGEKPYSCEIEAVTGPDDQERAPPMSLSHESPSSIHGEKEDDLKRVNQKLYLYICPECGKQYDNIATRDLHLRTHRGTPYSCSNCMKQFSDLSVLGHHIIICHNDVRASPRCSICGHVCPDFVTLWRHSMIHTGAKPYACEHCNKCFTSSDKLNVHMRTHTGGEQYRCKHCDKYFLYTGNLKVHMRTHTGEKPLFVCSECAKSFTTKSSLNSHIKRIHSS